MINKLIEEINKALDNNLYIIALTNALILPDICGKAEYPELKPMQRYKKWYQEYIGEYERWPNDIEEKDLEEGENIPYLSADVIYSLRCSLLHEGNPNVDKKQVDSFRLIIDEKNKFGLYVDMAGSNSYDMNIRRICMIICRTVKSYYDENKEKFNFFNYCIRDIKKEYARVLKDEN